ncbi:MAG: hypothetical protein CM15mP83_3100 [Flavobacteriaceae bacterium]|nr:MAG: hypothetical protein CM15mP83_3100 [Flavobacteriaceae bacterium]
MLDLAIVRTDKEAVITALNKRGIDASILLTMPSQPMKNAVNYKRV